MVIILLKNLIENYINNMDVHDIIMFSHKENIHLSEDEYIKIYEEIKNNWEYYLYNEIKLKNFLDNNFSENDSNKIYEVFLKYQKKYSSYL